MGEKAKLAENGNDREPKKDNSGLLVIQGGSIDDYFKQKMKLLEAKRKRFSAEGVTIEKLPDRDCSTTFVGFSLGDEESKTIETKPIVEGTDENFAEKKQEEEEIQK